MYTIQLLYVYTHTCTYELILSLEPSHFLFCFSCVLSSLITVGRTVAFSLFVLHWMCVIFLPLHNSLFVLSDLVCGSKSWSGCCACVISFTSWMAARSLLLWRERGCSAGVRFLKMILRALFLHSLQQCNLPFVALHQRDNAILQPQPQ